MNEDGLRRDSLRKSLKPKGRSRRKTAAPHAEAEKGDWRFRRNDILPSLRIEHCPVDALKLHVRKLRKNDPAHVREIANSISRLGFNVPVLIGKNNVVVDGHSRVEAAKLLGLSSVPCIRVDHLDETEQRLLRLAVNRLGEKGVWDLGELEVEFKGLALTRSSNLLSRPKTTDQKPLMSHHLRVLRSLGQVISFGSGVIA